MLSMLQSKLKTGVSVIIEQNLAQNEVTAGMKQKSSFSSHIQFKVICLVCLVYGTNLFQIEPLPINSYTANPFVYNVVQVNQLNLLKYSEYLNIFWFVVKQQITQHPEFVFLYECVLSVWNWEHISYHNTHKLKQLPTPVQGALSANIRDRLLALPSHLCGLPAGVWRSV